MQDPWHTIVDSNVAVLVASVRRIVGNDHDAEDVVQEVFAEAYRIPKTTKIENWSALLRKMAQRRAIDQLRRRMRQANATGSDAILNIASSEIEPSESLDWQERDDQLRAALATLADREASAFSLAYFDGMSRPEIAVVLEASTNAVNVAIHKAIQKLRKQLCRKPPVSGDANDVP